MVLSLCILSGFFIDLMQALALRSPIASMSEWLPVLAGIAIALLICRQLPIAPSTYYARRSRADGLRACCRTTSCARIADGLG